MIKALENIGHLITFYRTADDDLAKKIIRIGELTSKSFDIDCKLQYETGRLKILLLCLRKAKIEIKIKKLQNGR